MSQLNGYCDSYSKDEACRHAILALGKTPGVDVVKCEECPFPFCVRHEARQLKNLARDTMIAGMLSMHVSARNIAAKVGISTAAVYHVKHTLLEEECYWCELDTKPEGIFCRTGTCTVAWDRSLVAVVLGAHREATWAEVKLVEMLVEALFPVGIIERDGNTGHDHWTIENVGKSEANAVYDHMVELNKYAVNLR